MLTFNSLLAGKLTNVIRRMIDFDIRYLWRSISEMVVITCNECNLE